MTRKGKPACEALPGRSAFRSRGTGRVAPRIRVQPFRFRVPGAPGQLIGLISGVMTGVTAGAMGLAGAAGIAGLLRFAAFLFFGFFLAALRAGLRFLAAFFFDDFFFVDFFFAFLATRFFDERFFDDFFFAVFFLEDFFFAAFFLAAMLTPFNVDRLSDVRATRREALSHYQAFGFASNEIGEPILDASP